MQQLLDKMNLTIPAGIELEVFANVEPDRLSAEFYADYGVTAELTAAGRAVQIVTDGELRVSFPNSEMTFHNGRASAELRHRGIKDVDLAEMVEDEAFLNNNWFNLYLGQTNLLCDVSSESVCSTLDEAVRDALVLIQSGEKEWNIRVGDQCSPRNFTKGDLIVSVQLPEARRPRFYLITKVKENGFLQIRHATRNGRIDRRYSNYSHTGLAKNFNLFKKAEDLTAA